MSDTAHHGSCLCGGFTFEVTGQPEAVFICYCSHCTKNAGGPGQISAKYDRAQITVVKGLDLTKTFILMDTVSGCKKHKVFCETCGCTLWTVPMKHDGQKFIVRTSLIDNGFQELQPTAEFFVQSKPPVYTQMKTFDTMPGH